MGKSRTYTYLLISFIMVVAHSSLTKAGEQQQHTIPVPSQEATKLKMREIDECLTSAGDNLADTDEKRHDNTLNESIIFLQRANQVLTTLQTQLSDKHFSQKDLNGYAFSTNQSVSNYLLSLQRYALRPTAQMLSRLTIPPKKVTDIEAHRKDIQKVRCFWRAAHHAAYQWHPHLDSFTKGLAELISYIESKFEYENKKISLGITTIEIPVPVTTDKCCSEELRGELFEEIGGLQERWRILPTSFRKDKAEFQALQKVCSILSPTATIIAVHKSLKEVFEDFIKLNNSYILEKLYQLPEFNRLDPAEQRLLETLAKSPKVIHPSQLTTAQKYSDYIITKLKQQARAYLPTSASELPESSPLIHHPAPHNYQITIPKIESLPYQQTNSYTKLHANLPGMVNNLYLSMVDGIINHMTRTIHCHIMPTAQELHGTARTAHAALADKRQAILNIPTTDDWLLPQEKNIYSHTLHILPYDCGYFDRLPETPPSPTLSKEEPPSNTQSASSFSLTNRLTQWATQQSSKIFFGSSRLEEQEKESDAKHQHNRTSIIPDKSSDLYPSSSNIYSNPNELLRSTWAQYGLPALEGIAAYNKLPREARSTLNSTIIKALKKRWKPYYNHYTNKTNPTIFKPNIPAFVATQIPLILQQEQLKREGELQGLKANITDQATRYFALKSQVEQFSKTHIWFANLLFNYLGYTTSYIKTRNDHHAAQQTFIANQTTLKTETQSYDLFKELTAASFTQLTAPFATPSLGMRNALARVTTPHARQAQILRRQ